MADKDHSELELPLNVLLEALLFAAPAPVTLAQLASTLEVTTRRVEIGLEELENYYERRGLRVQRHAGKVQLTTTAEIAPLVERFLGLEVTTHLSRAAVEALAIIAYRQPITRPQVDSIRGVNSDGVIRSLLNKGLLQEAGRADGPGRPILYETTPDFLQHFGLNSLEELPPLPEFEEDIHEIQGEIDSDAIQYNDKF
jgi:segregation and condensation protein B